MNIFERFILVLIIAKISLQKSSGIIRKYLQGLFNCSHLYLFMSKTKKKPDFLLKISVPSFFGWICCCCKAVETWTDCLTAVSPFIKTGSGILFSSEFCCIGGWKLWNKSSMGNVSSKLFIWRLNSEALTESLFELAMANCAKRSLKREILLKNKFKNLELSFVLQHLIHWYIINYLLLW